MRSYYVQDTAEKLCVLRQQPEIKRPTRWLEPYSPPLNIFISGCRLNKQTQKQLFSGVLYKMTTTSQ